MGFENSKVQKKPIIFFWEAHIEESYVTGFLFRLHCHHMEKFREI